MEGQKKDINRIIKILILSGLLLCTAILYIYATFGSRQRSESTDGDAFLTIQNITYSMLFLLMIGVCVYVFFLRKNKFRYEKMFLIMAVVLGFVYMLAIPLMAVPDEYLHLYTAYDISDEIMGTHADTVMMREIDVQHAYNGGDLTRNDYNQQYAEAFAHAGRSQMVDTGITASQTPRYLYIIPAIGITIGRLLGLGTTLTYMLGRLCNLILFLSAAYYAMKRMPFGKGIVMVWALLPITLQQVASFSYDAPLFSLCILVVGTTMSAVYGQEKEKKTRIVNLVVMLASCILLLPCKGFSLLPLAVFPLMGIPHIWRTHQAQIDAWKQKIKPWMKGLAGGIACVIVIIGVICIARLVQDWIQPEHINQVYIAWADEQGYTIGYFIRHPVAFIKIMLNTIWYKSDIYMKQMLGGMLGWLDIEIPFVFSLGFLLLMIYTAFRKENEVQDIRNGQRIWMILVCFGTSLLAVMAMLLYWTPNSVEVVEGVQGRYFLPALVPGLLAIRTKKNCVSKNADEYAAIWVVFLQILVVTAIYRNIP